MWILQRPLRSSTKAQTNTAIRYYHLLWINNAIELCNTTTSLRNISTYPFGIHISLILAQVSPLQPYDYNLIPPAKALLCAQQDLPQRNFDLKTQSTACYKTSSHQFLATKTKTYYSSDSTEPWTPASTLIFSTPTPAHPDVAWHGFSCPCYTMCFPHLLAASPSSPPS